MNPEQAKDDMQMAKMVQSWLDKYNELLSINPELKLAPLYKISALKKIATVRMREQIEIWEHQRQNSGKKRRF